MAVEHDVKQKNKSKFTLKCILISLIFFYLKKALTLPTSLDNKGFVRVDTIGQKTSCLLFHSLCGLNDFKTFS